MCDYSLQHALSRPARIGDRLTTHHFASGTSGFAAPENSVMAVCVLPGTELAFSEQVTFRPPGLPGWWWRTIGHTTAVFRQVNKDVSYMHHDALEFPDGRIILLTHLCQGQKAAVLQLPTQPKTEFEVEEQKRAEYVG